MSRLIADIPALGVRFIIPSILIPCFLRGMFYRLIGGFRVERAIFVDALAADVALSGFTALRVGQSLRCAER